MSIRERKEKFTEPQRKKMKIERELESSSDAESEDECDLVSVRLPNGHVFTNLMDVEQGHVQFLSEKSSESGLFSRSFASCIAIIMKSGDGKRITLNHSDFILSKKQIIDSVLRTLKPICERRQQEKQKIKLKPREIDDLLNQPADIHNPLGFSAEFVSYMGRRPDFTIEIAYSKEGYMSAASKEEIEDVGGIDKYFEDRIEDVQEKLKDFTGKTAAIVHQMPCSMIMVLKNGAVQTFKGLKEEKITISMQSKLIPIPNRSQPKPAALTSSIGIFGTSLETRQDTQLDTLLKQQQEQELDRMLESFIK